MTPEQGKVLFSSKTNEWGTPRWVMVGVERLLGIPIGLDVASTHANAVHPNHFTAEEDAFAQPSWACDGISWLNPPYGRELGKWVHRAWLDGSTRDAKVACLIPSRTDTKYFHEYCKHGHVYFLKGRIRFLQDGVEADSAPFPSAVVVFSSDTARFPGAWFVDISPTF